MLTIWGRRGSRPAPALQLAAALQLRFDRRIGLFAIGDRVIVELRGQRSPLLPGQQDPVAGNGDSRPCFGSFGTARTPCRRRPSDRLVDDDLLSSGLCCHTCLFCRPGGLPGRDVGVAGVDVPPTAATAALAAKLPSVSASCRAVPSGSGFAGSILLAASADFLASAVA